MPELKPQERPATYHRYLDAAEALFIRYGYEGASIRMISREARAPLGTLHHYWGNKEVLFRDTCDRRFGPIQQEQLRRLRLCEQRVRAGLPLSLADVVRSLIEPPILADVGPDQQHRIRLLYGRALTEPSEVVMRLVKEMFFEATSLFTTLLRQQCSALDDETFYWRCNCVLGAFIFSQSFGDRMAYVFQKSLADTDWRFVVDEIVAFVVRGMAVPP